MDSGSSNALQKRYGRNSSYKQFKEKLIRKLGGPASDLEIKSYLWYFGIDQFNSPKFNREFGEFWNKEKSDS